MLADLSIQRVEHSRLSQVDFTDLGFGKIFSDHMFILDHVGGAWRNPRIIPYGPLPIEPGNATLHYGQTVFEGLKAFRGADNIIRLFRPDMNAKRLNGSCQRLCIPILDRELFVEAIRRLVRLDHAWVPRQRGQSLYIRPLVIGAESYLEVRPAAAYQLIVMTSPVRGYYMNSAQGVALKVQDKFTRAAPGGTGFAKTAGNYAASLLPGSMSRRDGYDQALWLDGVEHRYVEEVGQMNIFFKFRDTVVTPALQGTILPGVTRDSVLALLREQGYAVEERLISIDEVTEGARSGVLQEAFGAGTAAVVMPVSRIGYQGADYIINNGAVGALTESLYRALTAIQFGETEDRHGWTVNVEAEEESAGASG
ncbi:MAG: branched-chain amino acid aminotransferase [Gammaproteobacteria bacterium]